MKVVRSVFVYGLQLPVGFELEPHSVGCLPRLQGHVGTDGRTVASWLCVDERADLRCGRADACRGRESYIAPSSHLPPASHSCPDNARPNPGPDAQGRLHSCSVAEGIVTAEVLRVLRTLLAIRMPLISLPTIQQRRFLTYHYFHINDARRTLDVTYVIVIVISNGYNH